tara:strand:- start:11666 stop:12325 length:660 start_codon:yes stop_codon:yes gene_type:complete
MTLEWLWVILYFVSAYLFFLALKTLPTLLSLNWKIPFKVLKLGFYSFLSIILFLLTQQLSNFYTIEIKKPIIEIQFKELENQHYQVSLVSPAYKSANKTYYIHGDMWQVDLKILTWNTLFTYFGIEPLYSLDRLNGRYIKLEDEFNKPRSIYQFNAEDTTDLAWPYIVEILELFLVRSFYGSAVFAPMANDARFAVYLTDTGIELLPSNQEAKQALKSW